MKTACLGPISNKLTLKPIYFRRFLTLIELLVVICILSLIAGIIGIKINQAMKEQRFRTEVSLVLEKLRLAQNIMLILNEDVKVLFKRSSEGLELALSFECHFDRGWEKEFSRPQFLNAVREIKFGQEKGERQERDITLDFLSGGTVMSSGILTLSTGQSSFLYR